LRQKYFALNSLFVNFVLVCFVKINKTTKNILDAIFHRLVSVFIENNGVTISPAKIILRWEKNILRRIYCV